MSTTPESITRTIGQRIDARTLINVAERLVALDNDHTTLNAEYSTIVRVASDLCGIHFDTIHEAIMEHAIAHREYAQREWKRRRGVVQQYHRDMLKVSTPKWDELCRTLI